MKCFFKNNARQTMNIPSKPGTVPNFSCYSGQSHDCDEVTKSYMFEWKTYGVVTIPLCPVHYNKILGANVGVPPEAVGNDEEEAIHFFLEYLEPPQHTECCGNCYSACGGVNKKRVFVWHFRDRAKYGGEEYMTTLTVNMCEDHFAKLLEKNDGKKPMAHGWDYWEASDSILSTLDDEAPVYETIDEQLKSIQQSGMIAISFSQTHNTPFHMH